MRLLTKTLASVVAAALCALAFCTPAAASLTYTFTSGTDVAVTGSNYVASGALNLSLGFAPTPGTNLTVVNNTGLPFISGTFDGVPQGGTVPLTFNGTTHNYIANYYGANGRSFVLQWPHTGLVAWGANGAGQLGNNATMNSTVPVAVTTNGVLAGKTVVAIAGGRYHSLALTSDGQVFAWGGNGSGQLGNGNTANSSVPVAVSTSGLLAGKTVVAIAAGISHSLVLTSDGQVFAWGFNGYGELGNGETINSPVPVAVALTGQTVVAIAAGYEHNLALTSDGQVLAWGYNREGELGNGSTTNSSVPVAVFTSGILAGETVVAIAAGSSHSLALASDGHAFAWGYNYSGELGNNTKIDSLVPVAVSTSGVLAGKTLTAIAVGSSYNLALTSDGSVSAWGANTYGQLGNGNTTSKSVPTAVSLGRSALAIAASGYHSLALSSDGQVFAWGYGPDGELGNNNTANSSLPVAVSVGGELAGKRVVTIAAGWSHCLALISGPPAITINPQNQMVIQTGVSDATVTFTAAATENPAPALVKWQVSTTGTAGGFSDIVDNETATTGALILSNIALAHNGYAYRAVFTNDVGSSTTIAATLTVVSGSVAFTSGTNVPITSSANILVSGSLSVSLGFAPPPGTNLTVVNNTGGPFINGRFSNISQGETVPVMYNGVVYNYIANYYGGNGRSLVLQWPCIGVAAWGANSHGQLGNNKLNDSSVPVPVTTGGALAGKTVVAIAGDHGIIGNGYSMALTSDGLVFAWGDGSFVPVQVTTSGVLAGKTVVAIARSPSHSLVLTSEGKVFAWGYNGNGGLGNNSFTNSSVPVAVDTSGILMGKTVIAIAAGDRYSLALTSDGLIYAWGCNSNGQLGNNGTMDSKVPVAVTTSGVLSGKTVVAIAAGYDHSLALASDGKVFAWGHNTNSGQLGNNSTTESLVPVAVTTSGVLSGKTVVAIAASYGHSLALASDGNVYSWGWNASGQLGNNTTTQSLVPVAVITTGALKWQTVVAISGGYGHSVASSSAGKVFAWGDNTRGQLGNNSTTNSSVPVETSGALTGQRAVSIAAGDMHCLALFGSGPPSVTVNPASQTVILGSNCTLAVAATNNPAATVQWQISATGTAGPFSDIVGNPTATTGTLTLSNVTSAQNGYAYRVVFTNLAGSTTTTAATLTVQRTFAWFQNQYGLSNPDPTTDPNHTGVCNLHAYAFGVNPSAPDRSQLPMMSCQNGYLQISYPRWKDAADLSYVVEVSDDLKTWNSGPGFTQPVSVTAIDATRELAVERDLIPISSALRRFIRVRIVK